MHACTSYKDFKPRWESERCHVGTLARRNLTTIKFEKCKLAHSIAEHRRWAGAVDAAANSLIVFKYNAAKS